MTHTELRQAIDTEWRNADKPLSVERARELADEVLANYGKEKNQFAQWFDVNGQTAVSRVNA